MAIDIIVKDGIDASIETKLRGAANAAAALNRSITTLDKKLGVFGAGGTVSAAADAISSLVPSMNAQAKQAASAINTSARNINNANANFTKSVNKGLVSNEKQIAQLMQRLEKTKPLDFDRILGVTTGGSKNATRQQNMYDKLFGAHNLTTVPPKTNYAQVIANATGTNIQQASQSVLNSQQRAYDNLFGAIKQQTHKLSTKTKALNYDQLLGTNLPTRSAAQLQRQQSMYNSLFNAVPAASSMPSASKSNSFSGGVTGAKAMSQANIQLAQTAKTAASAMGQLETSVGFLRSDGLRWAKVLWALGGATLTAGAIVDAADAYTRLQNRLSVVADTQGKVNQLTDEMLRISNASRQPIEATAKTYARLDLAMMQLGRSQADTAQLTENVAKALKLGGATAGEAASALLQVSQAFNKGKLDGDEFRSVMENSPILANALAKSLNVTRGELLKLAPEGKITAQVMATAFIDATDDINNAFGRLKVTIAESFTVLRNSMTIYLGRLNESIGFTDALSSAILFLSNNLDSLTFIFLSLAPIVAAFVGTQAIAALSVFSGYIARTAVTLGAIRSPITVAATAIANLGRNAIAAGASMVTAFNSGIGRAIALQVAVVRAATGVAMLANVSRAAGAAMLSMFSFGNVVLAITVATAAAIAFGDQLIMSAESGATLRDYTIAVFQEIGAFAVSAFEGIYDTIATYFGYSIDEGATLADKIGNSFFAIALAGAVTVDAILTVFNGLLQGVKSAIYLVGDAIYNTVALAANAVISLVNGAIDQLNTLTNFANVILNATGASSIVGEFGQIGKFAAIEYKSQFIDSLGDFKMSNGAAESVLLARQNIADRAAKIAAERGKKDESLRQFDADQAARAAEAANRSAGKDPSGKKGGKSDDEKRADIINKIINAEKSAAEVAQRYGDEKEKLNVIEDLNNKLRQKGYALLSEGEGGERSYIESLVQRRIELERIGTATEDYYTRSRAAGVDYASQAAALKNLLSAGALSQGLYNSYLAEAKDKYAEATDAAFKYAKEFEALSKTKGLAGLAREQAEAIYAASEDSKGKRVPLTEGDIKALNAYTAASYAMRQAQAATDEVFSKTTGAMEQNRAAVAALDAAYVQKTLSVGSYNREMYALLAQQGAINETMNGLSVNDPFEPIRRGFYQFAAEVPELGQGMADAISGTLGNAVDNISGTLTDMILNFDAYGEKVAEALNRPVSTLDIMRYALSDIIGQIGKELINAIIKMGVQWAITRAMQAAADKAAITTTAATQAAAMGTIAATAAPAAMATSVATSGGAAAAGMSGMTMAMLAVGGIMALAMSAGKFKDGGELGGMGTGRSDSTLFWGSRGEMVMNKDAVEANRPILQAMNSGAAVGASFVDNSVHVSVVYNGDGSKSQSGNDSQFTKELVAFIDARAMKAARSQFNQGKQGYGV